MEITNLETISIKNKYIQKVNGCQISTVEDGLSIEEPLEIRLKFTKIKKWYCKQFQ